jgi:hypothetical protein
MSGALQGKNDSYCYNNANKGLTSRYYACANNGKYESILNGYLPLALKMIKLFHERDKKDLISSLKNP